MGRRKNSGQCIKGMHIILRIKCVCAHKVSCALNESYDEKTIDEDVMEKHSM